MKRDGLPLVDLAVLRPFVAVLSTYTVDVDGLLARFGLSVQLLNATGSMVHVLVVHQFLETAAEETGDPFLASTVADHMQLELWPIMTAASRDGQSLGDFLSEFVALGSETNTSAIQYLRLRGAQAEIGEERHFASPIKPAQNDAFMATLWIRLLEHALGRDFDPSDLLVSVAEPNALPSKFGMMTVAKGDRMGAHVAFPTRWLGRPLIWAPKAHTSEGSLLPRSALRDFRTAFQQVLRSHSFEKRLSSAEAASLVSMSRQTLSRRLAALGTTIQGEINAIQIERACDALASSDRSISEIALELGYSSPANFSRTFSREVGVSPSVYRRKHGKPS